VVKINIDGNIEELVKRAMTLHCNISDGELTLLDSEKSISITEDSWK
jgi:uncharacterized protein YaeQ